MQEAVLQIFRDDLEKPAFAQKDLTENRAERTSLLTAIDLAISEEKQFISTNEKIPEGDKEGAFSILTQLYEAVKNENRSLITALVCGYNYFVLYYDCLSDGVASLVRQIAEYCQSK